jgi:cysteine-rich repeat protein
MVRVRVRVVRALLPTAAACVVVGLAACMPSPAAVPQQEDCATAGDEDGNGLADCADPVCAGGTACQAPVCGDGVQDPGEGCDDGNAIDGDGCDHNCTVTVCGNGIVTAGEGCDDGNAIDGDGCDHNCTVTACGNGIVTAGEACDDGNATDGDGCNACQLAACPSGVPVEPGKGDSFPLAGPIARIVTSPASCLVYALTVNPPTQLIVFSAASKQELVRIALPDAEDIAISPAGNCLVAAHGDAKQLTVIDTATWRVATVPTNGTPRTVQVDNNGIAYYGQGEDHSYPETDAIVRVDLSSEHETPIANLVNADVMLSNDGAFLYGGESGVTASNLFRYAVSSTGSTTVDRTTYGNRYGFDNPDRHTYLSPGGQHIYFAGVQVDAHALDFVTGRTDERIYAEDAAGSFAVGASHVFDAQLVRPVATLPHGASAAALTASDRELWYYGPPGRLYYVNMAELVGDVVLGVREVTPGPISGYSFAKLIHDPVRPRLYGVDTARAEVVVIDPATGRTTRSIRVNTTPTDLAIDAAGATLFVGHQDVQGFARIRLDDLTFERYVAAPRVTYQIAAVSHDRVVTIDWYQGTTPSLLDATTGAVLSEGSFAWFGALSATADGASVFVGDGGSGGIVTRYSVATDTMIETGHTPDDFYFPPRLIVALPGGSGVYYAGVLLDGNDLGVERYDVNEPIVAVSPDGKRALSATGIYDVATGRRLGALPVTAAALAITPDSRKAFVFTGRTLLAVDLTAF